MPAVVNQETCVGCGACTDSCPVGAISVDATATVNDSCVDCGACVDSCPVQAIELK